MPACQSKPIKLEFLKLTPDNVNLSSLLTPDIIRDGYIGIANFILENGLDNEAPPLKIRTSLSNAKAATMKEKYARWREMLEFCFLIGEYQSATILERNKCPSNPLPVLPKTIVEYLYFKTLSVDTVLLDSVTREPLYTVEEEPKKIMCVNQWKEKGAIDKYKAALSTLHSVYPEYCGAYSDVCKYCVIAHNKHQRKSGDFGSCLRHARNPNIAPIGNPVLSSVVREAIVDGYEFTKNFPNKGNVQLLPGEIRTLRDNLVNSGCFINFQIYTMILLGIKCFLRAEELLQLRIEHFDPKYMIIREDGKINSITVQVQGKSDPVPVYLQIFSDDNCTEFCPIRHLIAYMSLLDVKEGFIFPSKSKLFALVNGLECLDHVNEDRWRYTDWLNDLRTILQKYTQRKDELNKGHGKLGTHTLRKTGYLFAVWGVLKNLGKISADAVAGISSLPEICLCDILKSARHKTMQNAGTYQKDASTLLSMVLRQSYPEQHRVSVWESIHIEAVDTMANITALSSLRQKPLSQLAVHYVNEILQLPTISMNNVYYIVERSQEKVDDSDSNHNLMKLLGQYAIPLDLQTKIQELFESKLVASVDLFKRSDREQLRSIIEDSKVLSSMNTPHEINTELSIVNESKASVVRQSPNKKRGEGNVVEIPGRNDVAKIKDTRLTIKKLLSIRKEYASQRNEMVETCRVWYQGNVVKILDCLDNCYDGDFENFCSQMEKTITMRSFTCETCKMRKRKRSK